MPSCQCRKASSVKKTKLTPDPVRDPPAKSGGTYQCPGPHMIMPARAYGDNRFNQYPMTFRAFAICCSHANSWTGVFFPNQLYIAKVLQCSQQAVSQHMRKLLDYGYIEKLRNADVRRQYGKRGALWRVIYDPGKTLEDCIAGQPAQDRDPEIEAEIAKHTLNVAKTGARRKSIKAVDKDKVNKLGIVQDTASKGNGIDTNNKPEVVLDNKAQLVNNSIKLTNINTIGEIKEIDCRKLCNGYAEILQANYHKPWQYDMRQMQIARELLQSGYTIETFLEDAAGVIKWKHKKNQQPPYSLQYFMSRKVSQQRAKTGKSPEDIIKQMANKMRLPK